MEYIYIVHSDDSFIEFCLSIFRWLWDRCNMLVIVMFFSLFVAYFIELSSYFVLDMAFQRYLFMFGSYGVFLCFAFQVTEYLFFSLV